jgi:hypothetical protein
MKRKLHIKLSILALFAVFALVAFNQSEKETPKAAPCLKCCIKKEQGCKPEPTNSNTDYIFYESLNGHLISAVYQ